MIKTELVIDVNYTGIDEAINKAIKRIEDEGNYYVRDIKFSGDRALIIKERQNNGEWVALNIKEGI